MVFDEGTRMKWDPTNNNNSTATSKKAAKVLAESCPDLVDKFSRHRLRSSSASSTSGGGRGLLSHDHHHQGELLPPLEKQDSAISLSADTAVCEYCDREPQPLDMDEQDDVITPTGLDCHCRRIDEDDENLSPLKVIRDFAPLPLSNTRRRPSSIAASTITSRHAHNNASSAASTNPINANLQKWLNTPSDTKLTPRLSRTSSFSEDAAALNVVRRSRTAPAPMRNSHHSGDVDPMNSPLDDPCLLPQTNASGHHGRSTPENQCRSAKRKSASVSAKDQKILDLMLSRRQQQSVQRDQRDIAYKQWEADRMRSSTLTSETTHRRRQSSAAFSSSHSPSTHSPSASVVNVTAAHTPKDVNYRQTKSIDHRSSQRPQTVCSNIETVPKCKCDMSSGQVCPRCNTPVRRERELQRRQYDRKLKDIERKKRQEERKKQAEKEQEELARKIEEQQQKVLQRAKSSKEIHAQEQMLKTKVRNLKTKIRHDAILKEKLQLEQDEQDIILSKIEEKHKSADLKREQTKNTNLDFRRSHSDLLDRMEKSKHRKDEIDNQMLSYREDLQSYLHNQEKRAVDSAKIQVMKKKLRASSSNLNKTELQKKNLARLMEQEKDWKAEVEADIALKDSRIRNYNIEKQEKIAMSREMASTSRLLRDQLKCHYSMNDLDKNYL